MSGQCAFLTALFASSFADVGDIQSRLIDHRPVIQGEIRYFVREFEVRNVKFSAWNILVNKPKMFARIIRYIVNMFCSATFWPHRKSISFGLDLRRNVDFGRAVCWRTSTSWLWKPMNKLSLTVQRPCTRTCYRHSQDVSILFFPWQLRGKVDTVTDADIIVMC